MMNILKKTAFSICLVGGCLLSGCMRADNPNSSLDKAPELQGNTDPSVLACSNDSLNIEYRAQGDNVVSSVQSFFMTPEQLGIGTSEEETDNSEAADPSVILPEVSEKISDLYNDLEGVDAQAEVVDNQIQVTVTIDYEKANLEQLVARGLLNKADVQNRFVSLSKTKDAMESGGYACTVE